MTKTKLFKRVFSIISLILVIVLLGAYLTFDHFINPKSDQGIMDLFDESSIKPHIFYREFQNRKVRFLRTRKDIDPNMPVLVFVHGSPGSSMDFKRYLMDQELNAKANLLTYDRPGYSNEEQGKVLTSLQLEVELLEFLLSDLEVDKVILVGYSYGGTLVMASSLNYKKKIVLAAAVRGELEPIYWALNLTKWKLTKHFVPSVLKGAAKEKYRHITELDDYEKKWSISNSSVLSIHGKKDAIVPYQNSLFLQSLFREDQYNLISLEKGNHSLIWTNFDLIKTELIKSIEE